MAQQTVWFAVPLFPMFVIFFVSTLAETNRAPFDLPEAEAELVSGYNVEYSSMTFALFFLGEYANMILMSALTTMLFLGGWLAPFGFAPFTWVPGPIWFAAKIWLAPFGFAPFTWVPGPIWFAAKISFVLFLFLWVRATFPRYRYDQLMRLGWKVFLPLSLLWVVVTAIALVTFGWVPE
jgi:NADH-quinone oxidoreductase subunit H